MILGQIRAAAIRLRPEARVKNGLDLVFRADVAMKSSAGVPSTCSSASLSRSCAVEFRATADATT